SRQLERNYLPGQTAGSPALSKPPQSTASIFAAPYHEGAMTTTALQTDLQALLAGLSVEELRQRLTELDGEAQAVKVLLRAAVARERLRERRTPRRARPVEVLHA